MKKYEELMKANRVKMSVQELKEYYKDIQNDIFSMLYTGITIRGEYQHKLLEKDSLDAFIATMRSNKLNELMKFYEEDDKERPLVTLFTVSSSDFLTLQKENLDGYAMMAGRGLLVDYERDGDSFTGLVQFILKR